MKSEETLNDFLKQWPLSAVKKMTLEEYVDIENPETFTQWVETKTRRLGSIKGFSSIKFGIYKRKDPEQHPKNYQNDSRYSWMKRFGRRRSGAFNQVRNFVVSTIELAKKGDFKSIDEIQLPNLYKWKVAFLYSNQCLVPIFKKSILENIYKHYAGATKEPMRISKVQRLMMENKPSNLSVHEFMIQLDEAFHQRDGDLSYKGHRNRTRLPQKESRKKVTQYWALNANPKYYEIVGAINNLDRDWWLTGKSNIKSGDRLVFWQSKDSNGKRGVVGFGVAIGDPVDKSGDLDNIYWTKKHEKKIKEKKKRVQVRYVKIKKPIWEDSKRNKALLTGLTVCGGQGTSFHVTEEQWEKLLKIAKIDEQLFETEEIRIEGGKVVKLISIDNASFEHSDVLKVTRKKKSINKKSSKSKTYRRSNQSKLVGDWAEEFVLKFLQDNPKTPSNMKQKYPPVNQNKGVVWAARAGDKPGYDLSYTSTKGKIVGVEVKGTVSKKMTSFELTSNEWKKAQELKSNYMIALVSSVGKEKTGLQFIVNPYKQLDAEPSSFECRIYQK
jgi:hypothetical protein